jgi:cobyrinic acid a,c-diamide synthase
MAHLLISAAHKSSGKTIVTAGLCAALRARGLAVQPFKKGPDYIDPMWLSLAAGRACRNLDFNTQSQAEMLADFARHAAAADIALIEGNKGLFDGVDLEGSDSNAALAVLLGAPVVLVVDVRGMTRGVAPLLRGYMDFQPSPRIVGVILNKVGGARHEEKLRAVIERFTALPVLGAIHRHAELEIPEHHLGLVPSVEYNNAGERIAAFAELVARRVDLDRLLELAGTAAPPPMTPRRRPAPMALRRQPERAATGATRTLRLGIARDAAFCFYYTGDLEALEAAGAELVPVDMLNDARLPDIDGLFIGGGFPESHMGALEANAALRAETRTAIEAGLPVYAECGGLMYLARSLTWRGETRAMAGVIPADAVMQERPVGRGYVRLRETDAFPWPAVEGASASGEMSAHEFHYSSLRNLPEGTTFAYEVLRGHGLDGRHDGIVYKNLLASYVHLRDTEQGAWAKRFVAFVRQCGWRRDASIRAAKPPRMVQG